jgi:DNA polymerase I-like protein with 3'-5' exonuclease and polymerase domains
VSTATAEVSASCALLTDLDEIRKRLAAMAAEKLPVCVDIETGYHGDDKEDMAKHPEEAFIVSIQFTNSMSWARMVPLAFDTGPNVDEKPVAAALWLLMQAVDDQGLPLVVAHGASFELRHLRRWFLRHLWDHPLFGTQVIASRGSWPVRSCTMLESYVEGENLYHGLKPLTQLPAPAGFGHKMAELADLQAEILGKQPTEKQKNSVRFNVFDPLNSAVVDYGCEDVVYGLGHHLLRYPRVSAGERSFIYKIEMGNLPIVCDMADDGIAYDWAYLRDGARRAAEFGEKFLAEIIEDFTALAGRPIPADFNFGSSKQLQTLFFDWCKMPVVLWTSGGKSGKKQPSTDAKRALPVLAKKYPAMARYMEWKRLETLRNNYLESYEKKYNWGADGRGHSMLKQHGTVTGRFSCEEPNYQQSPGEYHIELRSGEVFDFSFRRAIIAPPAGSRPWWSLVLEDAGAPASVYLPEHFDPELGWYFLGGDYSQIELRVMAAHAEETALLEAFFKGLDCHKSTAALMLGIPLEQVTKKQRQDFGKRPNFGICYQMGIKGMMEQYGLTREEARELLEQYHSIYPRLKPYTGRVVRDARESAMRSRDGCGRVVGKFGRQVKLWNLSDENEAKRANDDRTAGNAVIQGPATGDYVKIAMIRAVAALRAAGLDDRVRMIMNVHDALEFYVREDVTPQQVIDVLLPAVVFPVDGWPPLEMEWHCGKSWGAAIELEILADGTVWPKGAARPEMPVPVAEPVAEPVPGAPAPAPPPVPVQAVPRTPVEPGQERTVLVMLGQMPYVDGYGRFLELVRSLPGRNTILVDTPEGRVEVARGSGLGPEHQGQVSMLLGDSRVAYDLDSVDAASVGAGLNL